MKDVLKTITVGEKQLPWGENNFWRHKFPSIQKTGTEYLVCNDKAVFACELVKRLTKKVGKENTC